MLWQSDLELPQEDTVREHCDYVDLIRSLGEGSSNPMVDITSILSDPPSSSSAYSSTPNTENVYHPFWYATAEPHYQAFAPLIDQEASAWVCGNIPPSTVIQPLDPLEHVENCLWPSPSSLYAFCLHVSLLYINSSYFCFRAEDVLNNGLAPPSSLSSAPLPSWSLPVRGSASMVNAMPPVPGPSTVPLDFDPSRYVSLDYTGFDMSLDNVQSPGRSGYHLPLATPAQGMYPVLIGQDAFGVDPDLSSVTALWEAGPSTDSTVPLTAAPCDIFPCDSLENSARLETLVNYAPASLSPESLPSTVPSPQTRSCTKVDKPTTHASKTGGRNRAHSGRKTRSSSNPTPSSSSPSRRRVSHRDGQSSGRNIKALTQLQIYETIERGGPIVCPASQCPYHDQSKCRDWRKADFLRHLMTHCVDPGNWMWKCAGVPVDESKLTDEQRQGLVNSWRYQGRLMAGGCMQNFSRSDSLKRHLDKQEIGCQGNIKLSFHQKLNGAQPDIVRQLVTL